MSDTKIKIFFSLSFFVTLGKLLNFIKLYIIGNFFKFDENINFFFYITGLILSFYFFTDAVLQAVFIPYYNKLDYKFRKNFSLSVFIAVIIVGILLSFFLVSSSYFVQTEKILVFAACFFTVSGVFLKVLYEAESKFVENSVVDIISTLFFITGLFLTDNFVLIFVLSEIIKFIIKFTRLKLFIFNSFSKISFTDYYFEIKEKINFFFKNVFYIIAGSLFSNLILFLDTRVSAEFSNGPVIFAYSFMLPGATVGFISTIFSGTFLKFFTDESSKSINGYYVFVQRIIHIFFWPVIIFTTAVSFNSDVIINLIFERGSKINPDEIEYISSLLSLSIWYIPVFFLMLTGIRHNNAMLKNFTLAVLSFFSLLIHIIILYTAIVLKNSGIEGIIYAKIGADLITAVILTYPIFKKIINKSFYFDVINCLLYGLIIFIIKNYSGEYRIISVSVFTLLWVYICFKKRYVWIFSRNISL